jgi:DNA polymerase (family 10)
MKLVRAIVIALKIQEQLAPLCERIEIAGSIRRARPEVGDIDLVLLPKPGQLSAIKARCTQRCTMVRDGEQNCIYRLTLSGGVEIQLDIFIARPAVSDLLNTAPGNFGTLLLCRTGSKEHNIYLVEHAKRLGRRWNPYRGVIDEQQTVLASETEQDIFTALKLPWIKPEDRER